MRVSIINGGNYDEEPNGINNSSTIFKRHYKTSPGIFLGYNIWKNLEIFTFIEAHTFEIEQKSSANKKDIHSTDFGSGINYPFFIGQYFYIQPGLHIYLRTAKSLAFDDMQYNIPNIDIGPVLRLGVRLWKKY